MTFKLKTCLMGAAAGLIRLIVELQLTRQDILANNVLALVIRWQKGRDIDVAIVTDKTHR